MQGEGVGRWDTYHEQNSWHGGQSLHRDITENLWHVPFSSTHEKKSTIYTP